MNEPLSRTPRRRLAVLALAALVAAACTGTASSPTGRPSPSPAGSDLPATIEPDVPVGGEPAPLVPGIPGLPGDAGGQPGSEPRIVLPRPGQANVRPVAVDRIEPRVDGRRVVVRLSWWGGVEPCHVLDSVLVDRSGDEIRLTVREGSGPADVVCIEIAVLKATLVDLGELEPGEYTIRAFGDAAPVTLTIG